MGWGGSRKGSGRKAKPAANDNVAKLEKPKAEIKTTPATVPAAPRQPMFSDASVVAIIEATREMVAQKKSARTRANNPYVIRPDRFGPVARSAKKAKLAMDDNSSLISANNFAVQAWQAGGLGPNDATEGMIFLGYPYLSELSQRAEYRLFGEITSEEMTRKWIEFRGTDDESMKEEEKEVERNDDDEAAAQRREDNDEEPRSDGRNKEIERKIVELRQFAEEIGLRQHFKSIDAQDQYFGISHLYLDLKGANIGDLHDPENALSIGNGRDEISKGKLGEGCLKGIRTIEPVWCYPIAYNASNPLSPDWYDPQVWYVMGAEVHKTRLIPFISRPVADILKPAYAFGGIAMTQLAQPYVDIWLRTRESVSELIHAFSTMILSTNLGSIVQPGGSGGSNGDVIARMMMANMLRDNQGMMIIDKSTEDYKNVAAPISGLDSLQGQAQEHMFSIARIPAVKWTGIQPMGLNATSEGEMRAFNDTIHGRQEFFFRPNLTSVLDIMMISLWGERDPDITFDFSPLHEMTDKERGEVSKLEAETDQIRVDTGIVSQEEVRAKLVADPDSGYHGLDPDDVPELLAEEEQGLIPEGAGKGLEAELAQGGGRPEKPAGGQRPPGKQPSGEDRALALDAAGLRDEVLDRAAARLTRWLAMDWEEGKHPRDQGGKFATSGSGRGGGKGSMAEKFQTAEWRATSSKKMGAIYQRSMTSQPTESEIGALSDYTGDGYKTINGKLRNPGLLGRMRGVPEEVKQLDSLIARSSLPEDMEVHRGISEGIAKKIAAQFEAKGSSSFTDNGFTSTSIEPEVAGLFGKGAVMTIKLKSGTNALPVPAGGEQEVILPRGSKFKVTSVKDNKIVAELVQ